MDGKPILFPLWGDKGVHALKDNGGKQGLRELQDLQRSHNLVCTSFFFYLQLCTAVWA